MLRGRSPTAEPPPMTFDEVSQRAGDFQYSDLVPLRFWLRTAATLLKEAQIYQREGNEQQAFLLYYRHAKLVLEHLPSHPEAHMHEYRLTLAALEKKLPKILGQLESLKPRIQRRYEQYQQQLQKEAARQAKLRRNSGQAEDISGLTGDEDALSPQHLAAAEHWGLAVQMAQDDLTRRQRRRVSELEAEAHLKRTAGVWEDWQQEFSLDRLREYGAAPPPVDRTEDEAAAPVDSSEELQKLLEETRRVLDNQTGGRRRGEPVVQQDASEASRVPTTRPSRSTENATMQNGSSSGSKVSEVEVNYPTVPKPQTRPMRYEDWVPRPLPPSKTAVPPARGIMKAPRPPPKIVEEVEDEGIPLEELLPSRTAPVSVPPLKPETPSTIPSLSSDRHSSIPASSISTPGAQASQPPQIPRRPVPRSRTPSPVDEPVVHPHRDPVSQLAGPSSQPERPLSPPLSPPHPAADEPSPSTVFKAGAHLENGKPLRTIFVPQDLRLAFVEIATENTRNNIETCGILCGTLMSNALFISKLLIPEQIGTSDMCETLNENAIFEYCDREDVLQLGWIHTHPTQTCFMSSRDCHTHSGYQVMLPESIAIVCAPNKTPSWGIFRLTDPPGMPIILKCTDPTPFHPHEVDEGSIYTTAYQPGHVYMPSGLSFEVVDLRPGMGVGTE